MAGDRKGLATALFQVKGSIDDPEVTYLPMKSFTTGLTGVAQLAFDLLKNTVMLPIDILFSPQGGRNRCSTRRWKSKRHPPHRRRSTSRNRRSASRPRLDHLRPRDSIRNHLIALTS